MSNALTIIWSGIIVISLYLLLNFILRIMICLIDKFKNLLGTGKISLVGLISKLFFY